MKKILFVLGTVLLLAGCDNDSMEEFNQEDLFKDGNNPFIGTWEASGEFVLNGNNHTYKSTLIFINETEYENEQIYSSSGTYKNNGTYVYVREENNIVFTEGQVVLNIYTIPFKFTGKSTLETFAPGLDNGGLITGIIYNRK